MEQQDLIQYNKNEDEDRCNPVQGNKKTVMVWPCKKIEQQHTNPQNSRLEPSWKKRERKTGYIVKKRSNADLKNLSNSIQIVFTFSYF